MLLWVSLVLNNIESQGIHLERAIFLPPGFRKQVVGILADGLECHEGILGRKVGQLAHRSSQNTPGFRQEELAIVLHHAQELL